MCKWVSSKSYVWETLQSNTEGVQDDVGSNEKIAI